MIIGSSLIITTGVPPIFYGYPLLGLTGYLISAVLGLWLIFDILRSR
jgi:ubiquinone biosynthesis protein